MLLIKLSTIAYSWLYWIIWGFLSATDWPWEVLGMKLTLFFFTKTFPLQCYLDLDSWLISKWLFKADGMVYSSWCQQKKCCNHLFFCDGWWVYWLFHQRAIIVNIRWVDEQLRKHESFVLLYKVVTIDADTLASAIRDVLVWMNANTANCCGQCWPQIRVLPTEVLQAYQPGREPCHLHALLWPCIKSGYWWLYEVFKGLQRYVLWTHHLKSPG